MFSRFCFAMALGFAILSGCAIETEKVLRSPGAQPDPPTWCEKRLNDALDVLRLQLGVGASLHADAKVGQLVHAGIGGNWKAYSVVAGLSRGYAGMTEETYQNFPISNVLATIDAGPKGLLVMTGHHENITGGFYPDFSNASAILLPALFNYNFRTKKFERTREPLVRWFDLEVGASVVFSGRVGFSLGEFLDFLLGFCNVDIAGDDEKSRDLKPLPYHRPPSEVTPPSSGTAPAKNAKTE